jgi:tetratricopeptide (TPR) repeat protein
MVVGDSNSTDKAATIGVRRLYTPAMLAELLSLPVGAVRRWHRQGVLQAVQCVHRLPYFDFQEVTVARRLAELTRAGCSLRAIDRRLAELARLLPDVERPLVDPAVVVEGRRLYLRRGDDLAEPGGQLLLDFDHPPAGDDADAPPTVLSIARQSERLSASDGDAANSTIDQLYQSALDCEDDGDLAGAAEAYRTILMAAGPRAEIHLALADVLYRAGDLPAARERYYATLELDEDYVEARASLGCVLAESGELELAAATFEGALACHPDFADVHYHLGNTLDRMGQAREAQRHWRLFLALAPESPWASAARERVGEAAGVETR